MFLFSASFLTMLYVSYMPILRKYTSFKGNKFAISLITFVAMITVASYILLPQSQKWPVESFFCLTIAMTILMHGNCHREKDGDNGGKRSFPMAPPFSIETEITSACVPLLTASSHAMALLGRALSSIYLPIGLLIIHCLCQVASIFLQRFVFIHSKLNFCPCILIPELLGPGMIEIGVGSIIFPGLIIVFLYRTRSYFCASLLAFFLGIIASKILSIVLGQDCHTMFADAFVLVIIVAKLEIAANAEKDKEDREKVADREQGDDKSSSYGATGTTVISLADVALLSDQ